MGRDTRELRELMEMFYILIAVAGGYTVFTFVKTHQAHLKWVHFYHIIL